MTPALRDLSRLCIHTATTKPWGIEEAVSRYSAAGVRGITVWRTAFADRGPAAAGRLIRDSGLRVVSLCRGGFFPAGSAEQRARAGDGRPLGEPRRQIADGIASVLPPASAAGVRLAVEPLHPMYAGERSAVNTLGQARARCRQIG